MAYGNEAKALVCPVGDPALNTIKQKVIGKFVEILAKKDSAQLVSLSEEEEYICDRATD